MEPSLVNRIFKHNKPFVLYHTYEVNSKSLNESIKENKSIDLDIAIDSSGNPFLGHTLEFYEKSGEEKPSNMPLWEAVSIISKANIPVIVDCKQNEAWPIIEKVIEKIGQERCLVHAFTLELKFDYDLSETDYLSEWSGVEKLVEIKNKFPNVTTTASAKFLPKDLLTNEQYSFVLKDIRAILKSNQVDTLCLNVPDESISDKILEFFLEEKIIPHINIDHVDISKFTQLYLGETDLLSSASNCRVLNY